MKLYVVVKELERSERCVFSTEDLARVIASDTNVASVYAPRMKFALGEDAFIVASRTTQPSSLIHNGILPAQKDGSGD